jgi:hypothetical protein
MSQDFASAQEAFLTETPDPWTRIEAECVIQLIDAELIAMGNRRKRAEPLDIWIRRLKVLRTRTVLAIKTLDAIQRHSTPATVEATDTASRWPNKCVVYPRLGEVKAPS